MRNNNAKPTEQEDLGEVDWSQCPGIERRADKMSGAWCFEGTRVTVASLFENLAGGASITGYIKQFPDVETERVIKVLEFQADRLKAMWQR